MRTKYETVVIAHEKDLENRKAKYLGDLLNQKDEHDKTIEDRNKEHVIANQVTRAEHERAMDTLRSQ